MLNTQVNIIGGNVTILGNFNPAIVRPEFIDKEFSEWNVGRPLDVSDEAATLVSDVRYENVRFFVDPERMIIEDLGVTTLDQMKAPRIMRDYFHKLKYTPIKKIGVNLLIDVPSTKGSIWNNIADVSRVAEKITQIEHSLLRIQLGYVGPNLLLSESTILTRGPLNLKFLINLNRLSEERTRISFNAEFQEIDNPQECINLVADRFLDIYNIFFGLLNALEG